MSNQHDLARGYQGRSHLFIEGCLFRYSVTFIVSFLAMNQMAMEVVGIVGGDSDGILRSTVAEIAKYMRCVVIDDDDHSTRPNGPVRGRFRSGRFKKFPEPRHFLGAKLGRA